MKGVPANSQQEATELLRFALCPVCLHSAEQQDLKIPHTTIVSCFQQILAWEEMKEADE